MSPAVLILSSIYDFSTDLICDTLSQIGISFVRVNRETLPQSRVTLHPETPLLHYEIDGFQSAIGPGLRSVYYRQPVFPRNTPSTPLSLEQQLDVSQWSAFIRGFTVFDEVAWVNHPQATYLAESKPYQLRCASRLGFRIPESLITNSPTALSNSNVGDPFVLKSVDTVLLRSLDEEIFAYTGIREKGECLNSYFASIPAICQNLLDPKVDLRATVIGSDIYVVSICDRNKPIRGDWRLINKNDLVYTDYEIPAEDKLRCVSLVKELGLRFGAIDLAQTEAGIFFVEINPTGEWSWLSSPSRPFATKIADLLAGN
jgi:hypothetical protein